MGEAKRRAAATAEGPPKAGFFVRVVYGDGYEATTKVANAKVLDLVAAMDDGMSRLMAGMDGEGRRDARADAAREAGRALRDPDHAMGRRYQHPAHVYNTVLWLAATSSPEARSIVEARAPFADILTVVSVVLSEASVGFAVSDGFVVEAGALPGASH